MSFSQVSYDTISYREDQLYFSILLNTFADKPPNYHESGYSYGYELGFIRDFPVNKRNNIGWAAGLGYAYDYYRNNIGLAANDLKWFPKGTDNNFTFHRVIFPIELRWRSSTAEAYNFWRIYVGIQASYVFNYKYEGKGANKVIDNLKQINNFQYGISFCAGYGKLNFYTYYAIQSSFKKRTKIDEKDLEMNNLQIGIRFFLL